MKQKNNLVEKQIDTVDNKNYAIKKILVKKIIIINTINYNIIKYKPRMISKILWGFLKIALSILLKLYL